MVAFMAVLKEQLGQNPKVVDLNKHKEKLAEQLTERVHSNTLFDKDEKPKNECSNHYEPHELPNTGYGRWPGYGYCPCCGRGGYYFPGFTFPPHPIFPGYPYWQQPVISYGNVG